MPPTQDDHNASPADMRRRADAFARRAYADVWQRVATLLHRRPEPGRDDSEATPPEADEPAS